MVFSNPFGGRGIDSTWTKKRGKKNRKELRKSRKAKSWNVREKRKKDSTRRERKGLKEWIEKKKCLHLLQATMIMGIQELLHMGWVVIMEK